MQGGAADGAARQENRFELGYRRECARSADLNGNSFELRLGLLGSVFIGDSPARRFGSEAGLLALGKRIELNHGAVGLERELAPQFVQFVDGRDQFITRRAAPGLFGRSEPESFQPG